MPPTRSRWLASAAASVLCLGLMALGTDHPTRPDQTVAAEAISVSRTFRAQPSRSRPYRDVPEPPTTTTAPPSTTTSIPSRSRPNPDKASSSTTRLVARRTPTTVQKPPPSSTLAGPATSSGYVSPIPRNATEACIVQREHGGSYSRGTNPTHFGRYQFSRSTWAANGGNPDTWGIASPQEQDAVFIRTVQRNGYRDWLPYNGCR